MKRLPALVAIVACGALFGVGAFFLTGCATQAQLDPAGPYAGDAALYSADRTITAAYSVIQSFVAWEHRHRATLPPEISRAADQVREEAPRAFASALALRDAYAAAPTPRNRDALRAALSVLTAVVAEAMKYLPPPDAVSGEPRVQS